MANLITEAEVYELYKQYKTPEHVIAHCKAVSDTGIIIGQALNEKGLNLDIQLIKISGLVHDFLRVEEDHDIKAGQFFDKKGMTELADCIRGHMSYRFKSLDTVCPGGFVKHL